MSDPQLCTHHVTVVDACTRLAHVDDETTHRIATDLAGACPACLSLKEGPMSDEQKSSCPATPNQEVLGPSLGIMLMTKVRDVVAHDLQHASYLAVDFSDSKRIWDYRAKRLAEFDAAIKEMESND